MKKILCLIDHLGSGGAQRQLVNLAILLKNNGYLVDFVVYMDVDFYKPILESEEIPIHMVIRTSKLGRILGIRSYIRENSPDVVITFLETPGFLACISKMGRNDWKLITNELSSKLITFTGRKNCFYNWFERFSDTKVCNSKNAKDMWMRYYPQYQDKYRVIYNPVIIQNKPDEDFHFKKDGKLNLVVAASYQELKNPLGLIEAVMLLNKDVRKQIVINWYGRAEVTIGNTAIYDDSVNLIKKNSLGSVIHLHQETREIYDIMKKADAVGLFSTVEGLPNVICEAMTLGKPIIMSKVSDYQVLTYGNGVTCEPTPESIAEGLVKLLSYSPEELRKMGNKSCQKAKELFSVETITKQWMEVIEE